MEAEAAGLPPVLAEKAVEEESLDWGLEAEEAQAADEAVAASEEVPEEEVQA